MTTDQILPVEIAMPVPVEHRPITHVSPLGEDPSSSERSLDHACTCLTIADPMNMTARQPSVEGVTDFIPPGQSVATDRLAI